MTRRRGSAWRRGALLLEVVMALTILVASMGVLAQQLVAGLRMVGYSDEQTRAAQLADRVLSLIELDPDSVQRLIDEQTSDGDFGEAHPGWFWRVVVEPVNVDGLGLLTVQVLHQPDPERRESIDGANVVRQLRMLKAAPGRIDLAEDFGVDQEQIDTIVSTVPIPGFDPDNLDPLALVSMDPAQLMELLPALLPLLQQFFPGAALPTDMSPDALQDLLAGVQNGELPEGFPGRPGGGRGEGGGGDLSDNFLRDFIRNQLTDQISDDELNSLFDGAAGGGPAANPGRPALPRGGRGGGRTGRGAEGGTDTGGAERLGIEDLNRLRGGRGQRGGRQP